MALQRQERVDFRLSGLEKQRLTLAADVEGVDLTAFTLKAALAAAEEALTRHSRLALSARDAARILDLLESPPGPTPELLARARQRLAGRRG